MKKTIWILFILIGNFLYLSSQGWVVQTPFDVVAEIQDVNIDESGIGYAVGQNGVALQTLDFGNIWTYKPFEPSPGSILFVEIVPGTNGSTAFAGAQRLWRTQNKGESWEIVNFGTSPRDIEIIDQDTIISASQGKLLISNDGGDNWEEKDLPPDAKFVYLSFLSSNEGWIVSLGDPANAYYTENGGDSWEMRDTTGFVFPTEIFFIDQNTGYLASRDHFYKTTDGGQNWSQIAPDVFVGSSQDLHVVSENEMYVSTISARFYRSFDGGFTWDELNLQDGFATTRLDGIDVVNGDVYVGGNLSSIFKSSNMGSTWVDQIPSLKDALYSIEFIDEQKGYACGQFGAVLKTTDGGAVWESVGLKEDSLTQATYISLAAENENEVWITGSNRVIKTDDGGQTWQVKLQDFVSFESIEYMGGNTVIALGSSGQLYRTIDDGATWSKDTIPGSQFQEIENANEMVAMAVARNGRIVRTEDGGITWTTVYDDGTTPFRGIGMVNENEVFAAAGFSDTLWHSSNGGSDWEKILLPFRNFWEDVSFYSSTEGYVCGGSAVQGRILRTLDGGQTWESNIETDVSFFGLSTPIENDETAYACGRGGIIAKWVKCTNIPSISNLQGELNPCEGDTVIYSVNQEDVAIFEWGFPNDWNSFGATNTSEINLIIGSTAGEVSIFGSNTCDFSDTLSISITPAPVPAAQITMNGFVLESQTQGQAYQWFVDGIKIEDALSDSHVPQEDGDYWVLVLLDNGCWSKPSNIISVIASSTEEIIQESKKIRISPNPFKDQLTLDSDHEESLTGLKEIAIYDMTLKKVSSFDGDQFVLNLVGLNSGLYILSGYDNEGLRFTKKIIKL